MEKPAQEIDAVVHMLTCAANPDIQKAAIQRFYTSDAGFRHPLCYIPPAHNSREDILGVYQWYRIMSPHIELVIHDVVYAPEHKRLFLDVTQKFHIRWNPFPPAPANLFVHLTLREENGLFYIAFQEDLYRPDDILALLIPPLAGPVRVGLRAAAFASNIAAHIGQLVFGVWLPRKARGSGAPVDG
ncbi:hypothetical protein DENSPDRAFT_836817 [Dentipellis sp. KUC8613]|nr:hypothetical protein DENSPDRAFT_836817 [Dentipellis sp. KUC8613]